MKKYRKQIYRLTSLLCSIVLIVSLAAFPASAASDDFLDYVELLDYVDMNEGTDNYVIFETAGAHEVSLTNPFPGAKIYIDMIFKYWGGISTISIGRFSGTPYGNFTWVDLGNGLCRAYGSFDAYFWDYYLTINTNQRSGFELMSFRVKSFSQKAYPSVGQIVSSGESAMMSTSSSAATLYWEGESESDVAYGQTDDLIYVYPTEWKKFDTMDIFLTLKVASITSIRAVLNNQSIPFTISYISNDGEYFAWNKEYVGGEPEWWVMSTDDAYRFCITLDLRNLNRSSGYTPVVEIVTGYTVTDDRTYSLTCVSGYVHTAISQWKYWFTDLKDYLADLFGKEDAAAEQAQQSQEQLNVQVNAQVSDAVADWDVHIVEVQDGYDSGFEGAVPALSWLSSLAEGIFGNMGWFSSIYLLVGLISVYVLFLNKGGLIGRKLK